MCGQHAAGVHTTAAYADERSARCGFRSSSRRTSCGRPLQWLGWRWSTQEHQRIRGGVRNGNARASSCVRFEHVSNLGNLDYRLSILLAREFGCFMVSACWKSSVRIHLTVFVLQYRDVQRAGPGSTTSACIHTAREGAGYLCVVVGAAAVKTPHVWIIVVSVSSTRCKKRRACSTSRIHDDGHGQQPADVGVQHTAVQMRTKRRRVCFDAVVCTASQRE